MKFKITTTIKENREYELDLNEDYIWDIENKLKDFIIEVPKLTPEIIQKALNKDYKKDIMVKTKDGEISLLYILNKWFIKDCLDTDYNIINKECVDINYEVE